MNRSDAIIEVDGVTTVLDGHVIHRGLNLTVYRGEVMALIGGSGSGKTTLLRLLLGLEVPQAGSVKIFGHPLGRCAARDLERVRYRWGVLFQHGALFSALNVFDNIALPLRELNSVPDSLVKPLVMLKLAQVGLKPADAFKRPAELSGGMVKRVSLARALILDPQLLFLDEPTAGLDPDSAKQFVRLLRRLRQELGLTVVMVTHDVDTLFAVVDRVAVLAEQRIMACGPLAEVARLPHAFVRNFFLGHLERCAEDDLRRFRLSLDDTSDDGGVPALLREAEETQH
ncbi:MAG: ATP-binding cassette domain-containing protein [Roseateles sp.]|jgi:phospholipid/cholesterol/gamma-HCH transport system ATP-binding protein|nr:ABC transporter ATP-binding protein [Methylibium sp.]MBY0368456.1 ATP-binding cassette domain-containing protein [Burkholderiaceae bacterium]|mmetsp:Transcript_37520/g.87493  ORF Transcript_37520/g.87493 Transcript_37520/m.87493 type:complete len:285 (-) Transcript_37520:546-1400(-)